MPGRLSDLLTRRATESFVGREDELAAMLRCLEVDGPLVVAVHGIGGIGKSRLLESFAAEGRARGATVVRLDCRSIEPTESGFLHELGVAIGTEFTTAEEGAERLGQLGRRVVLALDTYELVRLLDTWLRQVFVPTLMDNTRVVLAGASRSSPVGSLRRAGRGW